MCAELWQKYRRWKLNKHILFFVLLEPIEININKL